MSDININDFISVLIAARTVRRHLTSPPTGTPKTFLEQIQPYDDGTNRRLYIWVNNTWRYLTLT